MARDCQEFDYTDDYLRRSLAWLAPDVIEAILDGAQLPEVSLDQLTAGFWIERSE